MPKPKINVINPTIDPDIAIVASGAQKHFLLAADKAVANTIDDPEPRRV